MFSIQLTLNTVNP